MDSLVTILERFSFFEYTLHEKWKDLIDTKSDPRTRNWFGMQSPFAPIIFGLFYIQFATVWGPRFMKNRKPFDVGKLQMTHNLIHLTINFFFVYMSSYGIERNYLNGISYRCEPYDNSTSPRAMTIATMCWLFYLSKYTDCFETVLFVLRKRDHMVNYYHVFHHSMMPFTIWVITKYFPSGHACFFGFINPIVHIVYYSYYTTKQLYPRIKEIFWWFRTFSIIFQVSQFVILILHALQLLFSNPCKYPMGYSYFVMTITTVFYLIFMYQYKWRKNANQSNLLR